MKQKLQVRQADGSWLWVQGWGKHDARALHTTTCKRRAIPPKTLWFLDSLEFLTRLFPDQVFRVAGQLNEE